MWTALAATVGAASFAAAFVIVSAGRRRPVALSLPLAFSVLVAFEGVLAPLLSWRQAYARGPVLAAHAVALAAALALATRSPSAASALRRLARSPRRALRFASGWTLLPQAALGVLLAWVAAAYAPSNWDSMTYRLARVAHWIQLRSVEPYATGVDRQVALSPGAEYVLAAWQVVARSDRLGNFLQLAAWAIVGLAAGPLVRLAGAPRRAAAFAGWIAASVPMAVLQATSTQNDLVAAAACLGVVVACLPYMGARRTRASDAALLGVALAAAALVKPTALVGSAPFVAYALGRRVALAARRPGEAGALLRASGLALAIALAVSVPDAAVRLSSPQVRETNARYATMYLYPMLGEPGDRLMNLVRGVGRHLPLPPAARRAIGRRVPSWCPEPLSPCFGDESQPDEDVAGNALHVLAALGLGGLAMVRGVRLPRRARAFLVLTGAAWLLFQVTFRHNEWITRLESTSFALSPLALAALAGVRRRSAAVLVGATAAVLLVVGYRTALRNHTRPPSEARAAFGDPTTQYYRRQPDLRARHDEALREAARRGCRRVGLLVGNDSWDYPLTWRAMAVGIETRHVSGRDPWPCLVFVDGAAPAPTEWGWAAVGVLGSLFENGAHAAASGR